MTEPLATPRLLLQPVTSADVTAARALVTVAGGPAAWPADALDITALAAESRDPASATEAWCIGRGNERCLGLAVLRPPNLASLKLRAIGWRSRELLMLIAPAHRRQGYATEAVAALSSHASRDGVTFALIATVAADNIPAVALLPRAGFLELGRITDAGSTVIVYERAL